MREVIEVIEEDEINNMPFNVKTELIRLSHSIHAKLNKMNL